jgi:hypothetical protein
MISSKLKSMVQQIACRFGYKVEKIPTTVFPYMRAFSIRGYSFDFWIADDTARKW